MRVLGFKPSRIIYDKSKPVGPYSRALDMTRSYSLLGWKPRMDIETGLKETTRWHSENFDTLNH